MTTKTATVTLAGGDMRFEAVTGSGHTVVMDNTVGDTGAQPSELVGVALAGCTGMDVISILRKKRQAVTGYEIRVSGEQMEGHPNSFTRFDVTHVVTGDDIEVEAVRRAIELSATKYCSVGSTLASGALVLQHGYLVRTRGEEVAAVVLSEGPHYSPAGAEA